MDYIFAFVAIFIIIASLGALENTVIIVLKTFIKYLRIDNCKFIHLNKSSNTKYIDYYLDNLISMEYKSINDFKKKYIYNKKVYNVLAQLDLKDNNSIKLNMGISFKIVFSVICFIFSFIFVICESFQNIYFIIVFSIINVIMNFYVDKYNKLTNEKNLSKILNYKYKRNSKKNNIEIIYKIILDKIDYRLNVNTYVNLIGIILNIIGFILVCVNSIYTALSAYQQTRIYKKMEKSQVFYEIINYTEKNSIFSVFIDTFQIIMILIPIVYFIVFIYIFYNTKERKYNENTILIKNIIEDMIDKQ